MKLKAIVDDINSVNEVFRDLYTEKDGKWHLTEVEGMPTQGDVDRLSTALVKERDDHKKAKEKLKNFGDLDPTKVREQLDRIPELEALAANNKNDPDAVEKIVEARVNKVKAPLERRISELETVSNEQASVITNFENANKTRTVSDAVRSALLSSKGFSSTAIDDALMLAERHFEIDETTGKVLTKDGVGVTAGVDPTVWLTDMQTKRPHWWGETAGGGARGSNGSGAGSVNPFAHDTWNLTEQGKIVTENPARAEQLAKAAGTTVGGTKPIPKK